MTLSMFLNTDQEKASKTLSVYNYNHKNAIEYTAQGEYLKASIYHRNAAGNLEELQQLKNNREQFDLIARQIKGDVEMNELVRRHLF